MRRRLFSLILLAAVAACQHSDAGDQRQAAGPPPLARGPDPVLLRIPRAGGAVRAYLYPQLDSTVWTGTGMSIDRVLGFDPEGGALAIINGKGDPARIDLRLGDASVATRTPLTSIASANGADIYGIDGKGGVSRLTRVGSWSFAPPSPARAVFPQLDGSLVVVSQHGDQVTAWKVRPPVPTLLDTVTLAVTLKGTRAQVGDRIYFATDTGLVGIRTRDFSIVTPIHFSHRVTALAPTPSGDRVYVATEGDDEIAVIDRYTDKVAETIDVPGAVAALRMDPLGRHVLVKPEHGDSAWVIAVATNKLVGSVGTRWLADLPASAPDGAIAVVTDRDVLFVDGETLQPVRTIVGGAKDYWYFMFWNGFRPRAKGIDQPVSFAQGTPDDSVAADSMADPMDSALATMTTPPTASAPPPAVHPESVARVRTPGAPPTPAPVAKSATPPAFTVQFASMLNEQNARERAGAIIVNGVKARVVPSQIAGKTIYRVILGPYPTHATAEQVGQDSKQQFWVYPGTP